MNTRRKRPRCRVPSFTKAPAGMFWLLLVGLLQADSHAQRQGQDTIGPRITGFERFHRGNVDELADGGRLLWAELNCAACHKSSDGPSASDSKQAPILTHVAQRVRPDHLRDFLREPAQAKPGTTMPHVLGYLGDIAREEAIESLVHFLMTTGRMAELAPTRNAIDAGDQLYHSVGCVACHDPIGPNRDPLPNSIGFPDLTSKYSIPGLAGFLANPLDVRPSARMPHLNLTGQESTQIASFLLRDLDVEPRVKFAYYEGSWEELPDFGELTPKLTGAASTFDVTLGDRLNQFGMIFTGYFYVPEGGTYTFHLGSDDGSRLMLDEAEVVRVDGIHPFQSKSVTVELSEGVVKVDVEYFEQGGEEVLRVDVEGTDLQRQPLETLLGVTPEAALVDATRVEVDPDLAREGQRLFQSLGCASCHEMEVNGARLDSTVPSPAVVDLDRDRGCLSASVGSAPDFALDNRQREALRLAVDSFQADSQVGQTSADNIHRSMVAMNCYACHQRDGIGGVPRDREALFLGDEPEMGDEGRIPPVLTGVGAKLRTAWLEHVMANGAKDRSYMKTRMPRFGVANTESLVAALSESDVNEPVPEFTITESDRRVKAIGRMLVGTKNGLSCINCHTFGNVPSKGIQSISLTDMTRRLQPEWFQHYMLNPSRFRPGTRMPASWPDGLTFFPEHLDANIQAQIHAVWLYLSDGENAPRPIGLDTGGIELVAETEPVIYRNFIEGAGTRAIGVGYPEKLNLAFDANSLRWAMVWQGNFIDAARHWRGRGQGWQPPLGDNVLDLPDGPPFAILDDPADRWPPDLGDRTESRFRGYRLDKDKRPTFMYRVDSIDIEDCPRPIAGEAFGHFERDLSLTGPAGAKIWLRAAVGERIESMGDGAFRIVDWQVTVGDLPGVDPQVVTIDGRQELRVRIRLDEQGQGSLRLRYDW